MSLSALGTRPRISFVQSLHSYTLAQSNSKAGISSKSPFITFITQEPLEIEPITTYHSEDNFWNFTDLQKSTTIDAYNLHENS